MEEDGLDRVVFEVEEGMEREKERNEWEGRWIVTVDDDDDDDLFDI